MPARGARAAAGPMNRLHATLLLGALLLPVSCQSPESMRAEANMSRDLQVATMARQNAEAIAAMRAELVELRAQLDAATQVMGGTVADLERSRQLATLQQLAQVNAALADARRSYTDQHPKVRALQHQADALMLQLPAELRAELAASDEE